MQIHFQLTYDDFDEASRSHLRVPLSSLLAVMATVVLLPTLFAVLFPQPPAPTTPAGGAGGQGALSFLVSLLPWLFSFGLIWWFLVRSMRRLTGKPWTRPPYREKTWADAARVAYVVVALGAAFVLNVIRARRDAVAEGTDPNAAPVVAVLMALPWFIVVGVAAAFWNRLPGVNARRAWDAQAHLQRPQWVELAEDCLTMAEPLSRHEYAWDYFQGVRETPNLLVLYLTQTLFFILPKRALAGEAQLAGLRDLLRRKVGAPTGGFTPTLTPPARPPPPPPLPVLAPPPGGAGGTPT